jgi:hypothetical protein
MSVLAFIYSPLVYYHIFYKNKIYTKINQDCINRFPLIYSLISFFTSAINLSKFSWSAAENLS